MDKSLTLEFSDPYMELMDSFCAPDEPFREITGLSFVQIYHGKVSGQTVQGAKLLDDLATVVCDPDTGDIAFVTPDGQKWAQMDVRSE